MTDRIITAFLLKSGIVASGAIGARNPEIEFLLVIELALKVHADGADGDYDTAIASHLGCEVDRAAARSLSRDQHTVHTVTGRMVET